MYRVRKVPNVRKGARYAPFSNTEHFSDMVSPRATDIRDITGEGARALERGSVLFEHGEGVFATDAVA